MPEDDESEEYVLLVSVESAASDTTNFVVQRDGTPVTLRNGTQVVNQRP